MHTIFLSLSLFLLATVASSHPLWKARFNAVGFVSTPRSLCLVVSKHEKRLEVWGEQPDGRFALVHVYPVCALGTTPGPKRSQGDGMTPEGMYRISLFNPNSRFHLSMKIDYPNAADRVLGERGNLGGDVYIHGNCVTAGCVAIGDEGITELYKLCKRYGAGIPVLVFPTSDSARWDTLIAHSQQLENRALRDFHLNLRAIWEYWLANKRVPERIILKNGDYVLR